MIDRYFCLVLDIVLDGRDEKNFCKDLVCF